MQEQPAPFEIVARIPTDDEYRALCESVGWGDVMNFEAARVAVPNSLYAVVAERDGTAIGMGRLVGDGAIFFYVQDVAVRPDCQGQGVGRAILTALMDWIAANAPEKAFVGLFADGDTPPFYERFGFARYDAMTGMFLVVPEREGSG
ncbi:MAG TPA: GNAT family N-acetyltransferase [Aggregatilinea sp.]|uniref:GNAT family N-acetyltransferase n=1 Tax=Aggregatilinea sp. TaxID=2806333 RepID=UPI002CE548D6|nr:GNAT family N-acetyltransferase [Aggregatilinea sp.]HML24214.1 GNAT family N-acetyltransferase [Aggregatilinea sp.]